MGFAPFCRILLIIHTYTLKSKKSTILLENRTCAVMFFVNVCALSYFQVLTTTPTAGILIQGTGGVRKLRWAKGNKG